MVTMPDRTPTAKSHEAAGDRLIELAQKKAPAEPKPSTGGLTLAEAKKPRAGLLQNLGKLKPLLPILSGSLRMVDHGAVQALAHLLNLAGGNSAVQSAAQEELQQGLAEIEASHRELHLHVQDQTVQLRRIEDQITLIRHAVVSNVTEHAELAAEVRSLSNLVRTIGAGLAILLVILITLTGLLLARHH